MIERGQRPKLVETLYASNCRQIPETLRLLADKMEADDFGPFISCVIVLERDDGTVEVCGLGDTEITNSIGLLKLGSDHLSQMRRGDAPEGD